MSALGLQQAAQRRHAGFFRGTMRELPAAVDDHDRHVSEPRTHRAPNSALEIEALRVIRSNLEAKALSQGGLKLSAAQLANMMSAAQHTLRGMTDDQLKAVASSGSALETIVAASFNAVPITDATHQAALEAASLASDTGNRDSASQLARLEFMRSEMSSAARLREMGSERLSTAERALVASATSEAMRLGMPWALNNPELLRLGPSAIKALHEVQIDKRTYDHFTRDAGFTAKDAVAVARFAKRENLDGKKTMDTIADSTLLFGGKDAAEQERWRALFAGRVADTDSHGRPLSPAQIEENRRKLDEALTQQEREHPEHAEQVKRARDATRTIKTTTDARIEAQQQAATKVDDLDAIAAPAGTPTVKPKAADSGQPTPTQTAAVTPTRAPLPKPN